MRAARSKGGAAAACGAWVGYGFIHSGAPHNTRLEPTALSRRPGEVVEPAAGVLGVRFLAWAARRLSRLPLCGLSSQQTQAARKEFSDELE